MRRFAVMISLAIAACGPPAASASPSATVTPNGGPPVVGASWPTYHGDSARTGVDASRHLLGSPRIAWRSPELDGNLYAEPLIIGDRVLVATENNSVYSLAATTGRVQWRQHFGDPMLGSQLPCGDITPSGITGTPTIDQRTNRLYVVAFLQPGRHVLYALDVATGAIHFHREIDAPGADPMTHQQRAALAMSGDMLYVAFGGLYGDCGDYKGTIVGSKADGSGSLIVYRVPTQREAAIWAPSGIAVDASGDLWVVTGNSAAVRAFDYGNAVIRLSPDLHVLDYFAPGDWRQMSERDADLGSVGAALLNGNLVFSIGKTGVGYLLHADHLGGIGGQIFNSRVCQAAFGGTAYQAPFIYIPCIDGLYAVRVSGDSFTVAWRAAHGTAGPPIIAGGAVWTYDVDRGVLFALDPQTGAVRFQQALGDVSRFTTPSASGDTVFAPGGRSIAAITW